MPRQEATNARRCSTVKAQISELLTRYGEIVCLFWDIPPHIEDPEMNALARRLQPSIMVNNRGWSADGSAIAPYRRIAARSAIAPYRRIAARSAIAPYR